MKCRLVKRSFFAVLGLAILGSLILLPGSDARGAERQQHLRVDPACTGQRGCFASVQAALDAAEQDRTGKWIAIELSAHQFREKVTIRRDRVRLTGKGAARTRLHFDAVAQTAGQYHRAGWGTAGSATLTIDADQVIVSALTVENDFDFPANDRLPIGDPLRVANTQAVAINLDVHSDRVVLDRVAVLSWHDTLLTDGGRTLIRDSLIAGTTDFIFGKGQLLIERSEIRSRRRFGGARAADGFEAYVAAPSTQMSQPLGIVVYRSRLTREEGVADGSVALARPWHPTTTFPDGRYADPQAVGQVSYLDCWMDIHIHPEHWTGMNGTARDGTKRDLFRPQDARFIERGSRGPGARRIEIGMSWQGAADIAEIRRAFFRDWPAADRR